MSLKGLRCAVCYLFKTLKGVLESVECPCFLSSVTADNKDGRGLKLKDIGPTCSRFNAMT